MEDDNLCNYKRKIVSFKDFGRFKLSERRYDDNALNIYTARLKDLREDTLRKAKLKWSKSSCIFVKIFTNYRVSYFILFHVYRQLYVR